MFCIKRNPKFGFFFTLGCGQSLPYVIIAEELGDWHNNTNECSDFNNSAAIETWNKLGSVVTSKKYVTNLMVAQANPAAEGTIYFAQLNLYDLTAYFGAGNEPSANWCIKYIWLL